MEQHRDRDGSASPQSRFEQTITKDEFFKSITTDKKDRFAVVFFILNTLNFIENSGDYYCYCEKIPQENCLKRLKSNFCQICKIPSIFYDFESFVNKNRFNMDKLCKYYDRLFKELVKLFYQRPNAADCFLGSEYYYGGSDWYSGEYWRVSLTESIHYSDGIFLRQERDQKKKKKKELGPFPPSEE